MIYRIIVLIILILINGVFSCSELAFLSIDKYKLNEEIKKGNKRAKKIKRLLNDSSAFLSVVQICITIVGFLASAFASTSFAEYLMKLIGNTVIPYNVLNNILIVLVTILLSFFTLLFGELIPKKIALNNPDKIAYSMVNIISILMKVLYPFIKVLAICTNFFCKILKIKEKKEILKEEDIKKLIVTGTYEGVVEEQEKEYMFNIFDFNDKEVKDIMTPKKDCILIDKDDLVKDISIKIKGSKYTRYPVYDKVNKKIKGILNVKDLILFHKSNEEFNINSLIRPTIFFEYNTKIDDVFRKMQEKHISMAIVNKESEFIGIVTLEDAIEEILGNIYDEYDDRSGINETRT